MAAVSGGEGIGANSVFLEENQIALPKLGER